MVFCTKHINEASEVSIGTEFDWIVIIKKLHNSSLSDDLDERVLVLLLHLDVLDSHFAAVLTGFHNYSIASSSNHPFYVIISLCNSGPNVW